MYNILWNQKPVPYSPAKFPSTSVAVTTPDKLWLRGADLSGTDGSNVSWTEYVSGATSSAITTNLPTILTAFGRKWASFDSAQSQGLKYANASLGTLNTQLNTGEFTITILAYCTDVTAARTLIDKGGNGTAIWMLTQANLGNAGSGQRPGRWDSNAICARTQACCTGKPFVFTYQRTTVDTIVNERVFVNGKLEYARAAQSPSANGSSAFSVGGLAAGGGYWWKGGIGEVQIHSAILSEDQIRANALALLATCSRSYYVDPPAVAGALNIGWIGDSITDTSFVVSGSVTSQSAVLASSILANRLNITVNNTIKSAQGTKTTDWLPSVVGGGSFEAADALFDAAGVQIVCIELGVNDAGVDNRTTALYAGNIQRIAREFVSRGKIVVIMPPTYASSDATNLKTQEYIHVSQALADNVSIFAGSVEIWNQFKEQNTSNQLTVDGVHPLRGGQQILAMMYAGAIERAIKAVGWY